MQCQQISVGHGQEEVIDVALATAVRTDTWLVIENLQLASRLWLEQLYNRLSRLQLQAGMWCFDGGRTGRLPEGAGGGVEKERDIKERVSYVAPKEVLHLTVSPATCCNSSICYAAVN